MSKTVTYTGRAGRYFVRDDSGKRHYFPRNIPVTAADNVAALIPAQNQKFTVEHVKGDSTASSRTDTSSTISTESSEENN